MITGPQHHVAVITCIATRYGLRINPGHFRPLCHSTKRHYSHKPALQQAHSHTTSLPNECISHEPKYPNLSLKPQADNKVDLSKTRPATLEIPEALDPKNYPSTNGTPPLTDRAKHLFRTGKAYLKFYKTGFSNVYNAYKQAKTIRAKYSPHNLNTLAKYGGQKQNNDTLPIISQSEYALCARSRHDILKLIPFGLIFAICGEFTPLIVIALGTSVVPYPCRIPRQEANDIQKKLDNHEKYTKLRTDLQLQHQEIPAWQKEWLQAYRFNLTSLRPLPIIGPLYHEYVLRPRLKRHCDEILCTTILIGKGGFKDLDARSIYEWADKYALGALRRYILNKKETWSAPASISIADLCTDDLKKQLVPECDAEAKLILDRDWTRIDPECHWRTIFDKDLNISSGALEKQSKDSKDGEVQVHGLDQK